MQYVIIREKTQQWRVQKKHCKVCARAFGFMDQKKGIIRKRNKRRGQKALTTRMTTTSTEKKRKQKGNFTTVYERDVFSFQKNHVPWI
jgi:hypothetical protein